MRNAWETHEKSSIWPKWLWWADKIEYSRRIEKLIPQFEPYERKINISNFHTTWNNRFGCPQNWWWPSPWINITWLSVTIVYHFFVCLFFFSLFGMFVHEKNRQKKCVSLIHLHWVDNRSVKWRGWGAWRRCNNWMEETDSPRLPWHRRHK